MTTGTVISLVFSVIAVVLLAANGLVDNRIDYRNPRCPYRRASDWLATLAIIALVGIWLGVALSWSSILHREPQEPQVIVVNYLPQ